MAERICYGGDKFYKYNGNTNLKLRVNTVIQENKYSGNYCPFNKDEIERHIKFLEEFFTKDQYLKINSIISITENDSKFRGEEIDLDIVGTNKWHRFVMIWLRYLYESPFQGAMKDAWRLTDETKLNPFESVQIVMNGFDTGNVNHTLYGRTRFKINSLEDFKEKYSKLESVIDKDHEWGGSEHNPSLQTLFEECPIRDPDKIYYIDINKISLDNWDSTWEKRKEVYERIKERWGK